MASALRACPVCQEREVDQLHTLKFVVPEGFPIQDIQTVVACNNCGFVYSDMNATQADYDTFYSKLSRYEDPLSSTGSGETPSDYERLEETAKIVSAYVPSKEARILDIGCAGGGMLTALQRLGYRNLAGLDPSPGCVRRVSEKNMTGYQGLLTSLPPRMGTFDCVSLSHVLEHIYDVPKAISNLRSLLNDGGLLYIEVPDATRYANQVNAPSQDFNTEHINHFSLRCLNNAFSRYGYESVGSGERLIRSSSHTFTPSVYSVFRATQSAPRFAPDRELKAAVLRYFRRSSELMDQINSQIEEVLQESPQVVMWGSGQLALKLLAETALSRSKPVVIVDSNPVYHGRTLAGIPILPPTAIREYPYPVLIATLLHQREIAAQARSLGLPNKLVTLHEAAAEAQ